MMDGNARQARSSSLVVLFVVVRRCRPRSPPSHAAPPSRAPSPTRRAAQLGVAAELRTPTQPIYNEFSDDAILATQAAAGAAALVLATSLGVRVVKTVIKRDVPGRAEPGEGDAGAAEEDGIGTSYVRA